MLASNVAAFCGKSPRKHGAGEQRVGVLETGYGKVVANVPQERGGDFVPDAGSIKCGTIFETCSVLLPHGVVPLRLEGGWNAPYDALHARSVASEGHTIRGEMGVYTVHTCGRDEVCLRREGRCEDDLHDVAFAMANGNPCGL